MQLPAARPMAVNQLFKQSATESVSMPGWTPLAVAAGAALVGTVQFYATKK